MYYGWFVQKNTNEVLQEPVEAQAYVDEQGKMAWLVRSRFRRRKLYSPFEFSVLFTEKRRLQPKAQRLRSEA